MVLAAPGPHGPLNSLIWYVPSVRYTRGLGWRIHCGVEVTESSTNKQHIIITTTPFFFPPEDPSPVLLRPNSIPE